MMESSSWEGGKILDSVTASELERAIKDRQFKCLYQPQVVLTTGEILSVKVIVSWLHPEAGLLSYQTIQILIRKCNLEQQFGQWLLLESCRQLQQMDAMGLRHIGCVVDLSLNQLLDPKLVSSVPGMMADHNLSSDRICFEIGHEVIDSLGVSTQASLRLLEWFGIHCILAPDSVESVNWNVEECITLKSICFYCQDFTGYQESSGLLKLKAFVALSHDHGVSCIAEGVSNDWLQALYDNGCDEVRGEVFSLAVEFERLCQMIYENRRLALPFNMIA